MINPLTHARTREEIDVYRVEPYVVAADVYTAEGKLGRGGWTWYTGSASWFYRIGLETILGFTKRGNVLTVHPRVPRAWTEYSIDYRFGSSEYHIAVELVDALEGDRAQVTVDGRAIESGEIALVDDGATHQVRVRTRRG